MPRLRGDRELYAIPARVDIDSALVPHIAAAFLMVGSAAALTLLGCAPSQQWQGTIEERDGVVYVRNPRKGLWQDRDLSPIRFELEQTFGVESEPEEEVIGSTGSQNVAVDADGNIYLYDYTVGQLLSFAPDGSLRWRRGGPGQGPGQFFNAQGVVWDGASSIYVTNANLERLDQWTTDGQFVAAYLLSERGLLSGTALGFLDQQTLALKARLPRRNGLERAGGVLGIIDLATTPWTQRARVEVDVGDSPLRFSGYNIGMAVSGGYITVGDFDSYEFRIFDRAGTMERIVARDFEEMIGYPIDDAPSSPYSSLSPPLRLLTGHWLVRAQWIDVADPAADYARRKNAPGSLFADSPFRTALDLFDGNGRFLYSIQSGRGETLLGYLEAVGRDGKLYTSVREPFPQVRRYRVQIDAQ